MTTDGEPYEVRTSWSSPDGSDWVLTFRLRSIRGRVECSGFAITSFADREPLRAETLRALPFIREFERARRVELERNERLVELAGRMDGRVPELEGLRPLLASGKPRRRARFTTRDLSRVAEAYRDAWRAGSKSPTRDTAEALGLAYNQAQKLVQRCRRMTPPLLPPTDQGVALGPTDDAGEV